jgi:hypothetical protein
MKFYAKIIGMTLVFLFLMQFSQAFQIHAELTVRQKELDGILKQGLACVASGDQIEYHRLLIIEEGKRKECDLLLAKWECFGISQLANKLPRA